MLREQSSWRRLVGVFLLTVHALLLWYGICCHFATGNEVAQPKTDFDDLIDASALRPQRHRCAASRFRGPHVAVFACRRMEARQLVAHAPRSPRFYFRYGVVLTSPDDAISTQLAWRQEQFVDSTGSFPRQSLLPTGDLLFPRRIERFDGRPYFIDFIGSKQVADK
jgi:hypothetical protein